MDYGGFWTPEEGIVVLSFNPDTRMITYGDVFFTNEYGTHAELNWNLNRLYPGSINIVMSLVNMAFIRWNKS